MTQNKLLDSQSGNNSKTLAPPKIMQTINFNLEPAGGDRPEPNLNPSMIQNVQIALSIK